MPRGFVRRQQRRRSGDPSWGLQSSQGTNLSRSDRTAPCGSGLPQINGLSILSNCAPRALRSRPPDAQVSEDHDTCVGTHAWAEVQRNRTDADIRLSGAVPLGLRLCRLQRKRGVPRAWISSLKEGLSRSSHSTVAADRTSSGISGWASAVNWCLRTFATDTNIARAVTSLRTVHQRRNESEEDYFSRFVQLHTYCGNYLPIDRLKTLFVNGLDSRIIETVRSYLSANPRVDLALLLEEARRQGSQIREIISSIAPTSSRKLLTSTNRSGQASLVAYARNDSDSEDDQAYLLGSSDHTEDLPTGSESSYPTIDATRTPSSPGVPRGIEDLLSVNEAVPPSAPRFNSGYRRPVGVRRTDRVRNVPAPPIPLSEGTAAGPHARPGWQAHPVTRDRVRSMTTVEYAQKRRRIICYLCYAVGHISRSCGLDPIKQAYQVLRQLADLIC
eukprot:IDg21714t1